MAHNNLVFVTKAKSVEQAKMFAEDFMEAEINLIGDYFNVTNEVYNVKSKHFAHVVTNAVKNRLSACRQYKKAAKYFDRYRFKFKQYGIISGYAMLGDVYIFDNVYTLTYRLQGGLKNLKGKDIYAVVVDYHY